MKNKKGITLIALIITIIVMLILVAVSVQILIKSDLIGTAEGAGEAYKAAHEKEQNLKEVTIDGKTYASIEEYRKEQEGNGNKGDLPTITAGQKATKNSEYSDGIDTAIIPSGFTVSGVSTEKTIAGGLVIYLIDDKTKEEIAAINWEEDLDTLKTTYDQFVWIPIKNTTDANAQDINDMYICQGKTANNGLCTITVENGIAKCTNANHSSIVEGTETNKNTLMAGRLYGTYDEEQDYFEYIPNLTSQTYDSNIREPDTVSWYDNEETEYLGILSAILEPEVEDANKEYTSEVNFKEKLQEEYNEVVKSVYENEGFYIGRYETSNMTKNDGIAVKVVAGAEDNINYINWYYMYAQQKDYAKNKGLTVGSTMIQGAAYDQVMKFVNGTALGKGIVYDVTESVSTRHTGYIEATGSNSADFVKNIYDLEGNEFAWTTEAVSTFARVHRGAGDFSSDPASCRSYKSSDEDYYGLCSICQLYVK